MNLYGYIWMPTSKIGISIEIKKWCFVCVCVGTYFIYILYIYYTYIYIHYTYIYIYKHTSTGTFTSRVGHQQKRGFDQETWVLQLSGMKQVQSTGNLDHGSIEE